jgi:hypothetical protein
MKPRKVFLKREKYLWIPLTLILLANIATIGIPAKASSTVKIYIKPEPPAYIPGVEVGELVNVEVWIDSPPEWDNTVDGIIGWSFYVHVDPAVLQPLDFTGASGGYWLYDFCFSNGYYMHLPMPPLGGMNASDFIDIAEFITGWGILMLGAGGSGKLCTLTFISLSKTAHTMIELYNAYYYTTAGYPEGVIPADVVGWGQYNTLQIANPVAIIEGPPQGYVNTPVTFDGSYSYDPDGGAIVSYLWDFGDGTVISTANPTILHTYTSIGTYEVTLVVTDDEGQVSDPATHAIGITEIEDPAEAMQELIETIESWNLPIGTEISLTLKLQDAIHLFNQGNEVGAIHKLMDFIDEVEALRSKGKLEDWQADHLVTEAQKIIDMIEG